MRRYKSELDELTGDTIDNCLAMMTSFHDVNGGISEESYQELKRIFLEWIDRRKTDV